MINSFPPLDYTLYDNAVISSFWRSAIVGLKEALQHLTKN